jgi:predicted hydrocarbon binding protein
VTKGYIEKMLGKPLSGEQTSAWDAMGEQFCKHVKEYLTEQGKE